MLLPAGEVQSSILGYFPGNSSWPLEIPRDTDICLSGSINITVGFWKTNGWSWLWSMRARNIEEETRLPRKRVRLTLKNAVPRCIARYCQMTQGLWPARSSLARHTYLPASCGTCWLCRHVHSNVSIVGTDPPNVLSTPATRLVGSMVRSHLGVPSRPLLWTL